jgi:hypothetical protein
VVGLLSLLKVLVERGVVRLLIVKAKGLAFEIVQV